MSFLRSLQLSRSTAPPRGWSSLMLQSRGGMVFFSSTRTTTLLSVHTASVAFTKKISIWLKSRIWVLFQCFEQKCNYTNLVFTDWWKGGACSLVIPWEVTWMWGRPWPLKTPNQSRERKNVTNLLHSWTEAHKGPDAHGLQFYNHLFSMFYFVQFSFIYIDIYCLNVLYIIT